MYGSISLGSVSIGGNIDQLSGTTDDARIFIVEDDARIFIVEVESRVTTA